MKKSFYAVVIVVLGALITLSSLLLRETRAQTGCCLIDTQGCSVNVSQDACDSVSGDFHEGQACSCTLTDCVCIPPDAIELLSFTVEVHADGTVLMWETATEINNAGFNLYRASTEGGPYTRINSALIPAQGGPVAGTRYSYVDSPGPGTFRYILIDLDASGEITLHGPVMVEVAAQ